MLKKILVKFKGYLDIKKSFKLASFVLENGKYYIENGKFFFIKPNDKRRCVCFKVKSKNKNPRLFNEGSFLFTPYKLLLINKDMACTFVRDSQRYNLIQEKLNNYLTKLPYKTMECTFLSEYNLIISNVVKGNQFNDDKHLYQFIEYYFKHINPNNFEKKVVDIGNDRKEVIYCPQHGDCYSKNIFWNNEEPTLIDLDDVDLYPLFYDTFYHIIASKHENAFCIFKSDSFKTKIRNFYQNKVGNFASDLVDFYLGAYVYFWVNKMERKMKFHEIHFYLQWFEKADLSSFPTVLKAMEKYRNNLRIFRIKR